MSNHLYQRSVLLCLLLSMSSVSPYAIAGSTVGGHAQLTVSAINIVSIASGQAGTSAVRVSSVTGSRLPASVQLSASVGDLTAVSSGAGASAAVSIGSQ